MTEFCIGKARELAGGADDVLARLGECWLADGGLSGAALLYRRQRIERAIGAYQEERSGDAVPDAMSDADACVDGGAKAIYAGLTYDQIEFMRGVPKYAAKDTLDRLRAGVKVVVVKNSEVGEEGPFALAEKADESFWFGCFASEEDAISTAFKIGLEVCV